MVTTPHRSRQRGFSLVELMISMTILVGLLLMFVGLLDQTQKSWDLAQGQVSQFREARVAFDIITKNLSQATLNAYFEQVDEDANGIPERYEIFSELHYTNFPANELKVQSKHLPGHALFFQAPLGSSENKDYGTLSNLLNSRGYYVAFNEDTGTKFRPSFITAPARWRYRLMEFLPPTEQNEVYVDYAKDVPSTPKPRNKPNTSSAPPKRPRYFAEWYNNQALLAQYSRPLAENIVAVVISPREATDTSRRAYEFIAPEYSYDSEWMADFSNKSNAERYRHQLPPLVHVTLVAIDETTAIRFEDLAAGGVGSMGGTPYMQTMLNNKFQAVSRYDQDVRELQEALDAQTFPVRYKIFSTTVSILASKWSRL